ncbi:MAG: FeoB-associated Cys-rich membrane protein [Pyrinomonadaceae bacterium]|nr:FeoB-associated Cys-rich membrane protein [Pyrinomonadaceae bacterium]
MTQYAIVIIIIAAAVVFAGVSIIKKRKSFSKTHGCDTDCGCGK